MKGLVIKIIKSTPFEMEAADKSKVKHVHYTCAYKGRVLSLSTLKFDDPKKDLTVAKDTITINVEVEVLKTKGLDEKTGEIRSFMQVLPAWGKDLVIIRDED